MRNPIKRHENVPPIMIRNAAGLFSAESGAPFRIIPTKIEMIPMMIPITVDFSNAKAPNPFLSVAGRVYLAAAPYSKKETHVHIFLYYSINPAKILPGF